MYLSHHHMVFPSGIFSLCLLFHSSFSLTLIDALDTLLVSTPPQPSFGHFHLPDAMPLWFLCLSDILHLKTCILLYPSHLLFTHL